MKIEKRERGTEKEEREKDRGMMREEGKEEGGKRCENTTVAKIINVLRTCP